MFNSFTRSGKYQIIVNEEIVQSFTSVPNRHLPDMKLTVDDKEVSGSWDEPIRCKGKTFKLAGSTNDLPEYDDDNFCESKGKACSKKQKMACEQLKKYTGAADCGNAMNDCRVTRVFRWHYRFPAHKEVEVVHEY